MKATILFLCLIFIKSNLANLNIDNSSLANLQDIAQKEIHLTLKPNFKHKMLTFKFKKDFTERLQLK